jgi:GNAT superfamily N-acetyltransferase
MPETPELRLDIARSDADLQNILALQRRNLRAVVDPAAQAERGFVFAEHSLPLLRQMAAAMPQAIARDGDRLAGYSLAMSPSMRDTLPSLAPMYAQFDLLHYRDRPLATYRYVVGGQVCVDEAYRGQGLIGRLYAETRRHVSADVTLCVTEIARRNGVSLRAHEGCGFRQIGEYRDAEEEWVVVVWDFAG